METLPSPTDTETAVARGWAAPESARSAPEPEMTVDGLALCTALAANAAIAEQPPNGPPGMPAAAVGASAGTVTVGPPTTLTTSSGRMSGVKPTGSTPRSQQSPDGVVAVGSTVLTVNGRDASTLSE